jgi:outer membrane lipopolysaccharide assembly protein LptE/RlpB
MINSPATLGVLARLSLLLCLSFVISTCGFHLQGQNQRPFPPELNLYVDDPLLAVVIKEDLAQHNVALNLLESVVGADITAPTVQLTNTLKNRSELVLDNNGDALIWRYTLSSQYLFLAQGQQSTQATGLAGNNSQAISVSTDVDLSGSNATVNDRIKANSWALLYQQLGTRITRQISFE